MKILVIIISYNFKPWIDRCLGSLSTSDYPVDVLVFQSEHLACASEVGYQGMGYLRLKSEYPVQSAQACLFFKIFHAPKVK